MGLLPVKWSPLAPRASQPSAAAPAPANKYLSGGSAFRPSASAAKIKLFDLLSIYSVKYDSPGPLLSNCCFLFFMVETTAFSPNTEERRCRTLCVSRKHINTNSRIPTLARGAELGACHMSELMFQNQPGP